MENLKGIPRPRRRAGTAEHNRTERWRNRVWQELQLASGYGKLIQADPAPLQFLKMLKAADTPDAFAKAIELCMGIEELTQSLAWRIEWTRRGEESIASMLGWACELNRQDATDFFWIAAADFMGPNIHEWSYGEMLAKRQPLEVKGVLLATFTHALAVGAEAG